MYAALAKDDLRWVIHQHHRTSTAVANVKVATFDLACCPFERLVHPRVHNRLAFFQAKRARQHFLKPFRPGRYASKFVLERQIERRGGGSPWTAGTTAGWLSIRRLS